MAKTVKKTVRKKKRERKNIEKGFTCIQTIGNYSTYSNQFPIGFVFFGNFPTLYYNSWRHWQTLM